MPDKDGKLNQEDRQKIIAYLERFPVWKHSPCPICGSKEWMIGEYMVQPMTMGPGGELQIGGVGYPQVMLISNPCGYTQHVNAVMIGLVPAAPEVEQKKASNG